MALFLRLHPTTLTPTLDLSRNVQAATEKENQQAPCQRGLTWFGAECGKT